MAGKNERSGWHGARRSGRRLSFRALWWMMVFPHKSQKTGMTASGLLLVALSLAVGMAAYNSASNILFLTLSLLLGCLILSGILSWINFVGLRWKLDLRPPLRVGLEHVLALQVRNEKRFLPTYAVWFDLELESLARRCELPLGGRLDPRGETRLECSVTPERRGLDRVRLKAVGSFFPFGFLKKVFSVSLEESVIVWPATISYRHFPSSALQRSRSGESMRRAGQSGDLLALRRYQMDDSHRQIHWKATARLRQLMVRQTTAEAGESYTLWVDLSPELWPRPEQFELLCSFAASLANDLFSAGKLMAAGLGRQPLLPIRRLADLEAFFDALALARTGDAASPAAGVSTATPAPAAFLPPRSSRRRNLLTFAPDGQRGVTAFINGEKAAAT
jgi:uncharacterized protein (DUF58 family)